jgi:hypothetical protein
MGPLNGISDIARAADEATMPMRSMELSSPIDKTDEMIWVSK